MLGEVVAQQVVVHRIIERDGELESFPVLRVAPVLVLHRQGDGLTVDVLDGGRGIGLRRCANPHGDRDRHRREHVRGVIFFVQGLVANDGPPCRFDRLDVQSLFLVETHRVGHDDRRGARDRDEAHFDGCLLELARALGEHLCRCRQRKHRRERRKRRGRADRLKKPSAHGILGEHRAHHGLLDHAGGQCIALQVLGRRLRRGMVGRARVSAAIAAETDFRRERIGKNGHGPYTQKVLPDLWDAISMPAMNRREAVSACGVRLSRRHQIGARPVALRTDYKPSMHADGARQPASVNRARR